MNDNTPLSDSGTYSENTLEIITDHDNSLVTGSHHTGPLPSPDALAAYEKLCSGAAREILDMTKENQFHRHSQEKHVMEMESNRQQNVLLFIARGQLVGFGIVILYFVLIFLMLYMGYENAACVALGAGACYKLIGRFVMPQTPNDV